MFAAAGAARSAVMASLPRGLRMLGIVGLAANALDLTTSLIPSPADHLVGVPARSPLAWCVQLALLVPLAGWLVRRGPAMLAAYRALPVPRLPRFVLGAFFAVAVVHVALRLERYPFSPVAMFSSAVPLTSSPGYARTGYVLVRGQQLEPVSFLREGSPWFASHGLGHDYKAGWVMHLYAPTHSRARDVLYTAVRDEGLPQPVRATLTFSRSDGQLTGISRR